MSHYTLKNSQFYNVLGYKYFFKYINIYKPTEYDAITPTTEFSVLATKNNTKLGYLYFFLGIFYSL